MADREKVINGLECCLDVQSGWKDAVWVCPACPYAKNDGKPCETLAPLLDDALALLKAQEPVRPVMRTAHAQGADDVWYECSKCGGFLSINWNGVKVCKKCGRPVKWE